jgi:hypothetical protein
VEPLIDLPLSHDDLLLVPCNKLKLCDNDSVIRMPKLVHKHDILALESYTCAENNVFLPIANAHDEQKLLSSLKLNTLSYIDIDVLCNLNYLEERLFTHSELPCLSSNTYHFLGKHTCRGDYMVHRVYICSNLISPLAVHARNELEGCNSINLENLILSNSASSVLKKQVKLKEREHYWVLRTISSTTTVKTTTFCLKKGRMMRT